jgi:hypothetical protein
MAVVVVMAVAAVAAVAAAPLAVPTVTDPPVLVLVALLATPTTRSGVRTGPSKFPYIARSFLKNGREVSARSVFESSSADRRWLNQKLNQKLNADTVWK